MTTINKEFFIRNWSKIAVVLLLLLLAFQCISTSDLTDSTKSLKEQADQNLKNAKLFEQKYNALAEKDSKYEDTISKLKSNEKNLIAQRKLIYVNTSKQIAKIQKFNSNEIAKFIQNRYKTDSTEVKTNKFGTEIKDTIAINMLVELKEKDGCQEIVSNLSNEIANKEKIEIQKDGLLQNAKEKQLSLLQAIDEYKKADELKQNALNNTEKMLKKERRKKNLYKITTILAVVGGGYLLVK